MSANLFHCRIRFRIVNSPVYQFRWLYTISSGLTTRLGFDFRGGNLIECETLPERCKTNSIQPKRAVKIIGNIFRKSHPRYLFDNIGEQHIIDIGIDH